MKIMWPVGVIVPIVLCIFSADVHVTTSSAGINKMWLQACDICFLKYINEEFLTLAGGIHK